MIYLIFHSKSNPSETISLFETAAKEALKLSLTVENQKIMQDSKFADMQIIFKSEQHSQSLRTLTAEHVNSLVKVSSFVSHLSSAKNIDTSTGFWNHNQLL
jgi:DNA replicative helicase MCM subunit Mcm2 (Cdc46/Mcm family)